MYPIQETGFQSIDWNKKVLGVSVDDLVLGGEGGVANIGLELLAKRTANLNSRLGVIANDISSLGGLINALRSELTDKIVEERAERIAHDTANGQGIANLAIQTAQQFQDLSVSLNSLRIQFDHHTSQKNPHELEFKDLVLTMDRVLLGDIGGNGYQPGINVSVVRTADGDTTEFNILFKSDIGTSSYMVIPSFRVDKNLNIGTLDYKGEAAFSYVITQRRNDGFRMSLNEKYTYTQHIVLNYVIIKIEEDEYSA